MQECPVAQLQAQQLQASLLAAQGQLALTQAGNLAGAAQFAQIAAQANANVSALNALQPQIQALQAQLAAGGGSATQLNALLQQEEQLRAASNTLATQLNGLLTTFSGVTGVPQSRVSTVGQPPQSSASIPV